jgi:D-glycero-beta-D-manno-heptose 1-phosphate adenylyltransferase
MKKLLLIQNKILSLQDLERKLAFWRFRDSKVVFTNGCFDLIHRGHIEYLAQAANLGDVLIVGLNSDQSVHSIKGKGRPIQDESSRALILAAMSFVTAVVLFDEDTPYNLIEKVQPDILVKGADYKKEDIVGNDIVKRKGGSIKTIKLAEGLSTSSIIKKIRST